MNIKIKATPYLLTWNKSPEVKVQKHIIGYKMSKEEIKKHNKNRFPGVLTVKEIDKKSQEFKAMVMWKIDDRNDTYLKYEAAIEAIKEMMFGNISKFSKFLKD